MLTNINLVLLGLSKYVVASVLDSPKRITFGGTDTHILIFLKSLSNIVLNIEHIKFILWIELCLMEHIKRKNQINHLTYSMNA